ncbi:MAG: energy transducer TonB [Adhaeribacter sp.]
MFSNLPNIIFFWFFTIQPVSAPENTLSHLPENIKSLMLTQNKQNYPQEIFRKPEFPGGRKALQDYRDKKLIIPAIAFERNENKEVIFGADIIIRVAMDGSVKLLKLQKLHIQPNDPAVISAVKMELQKFIQQMPKWEPATKGGKPVAALDTISFIESYAPDVNFAAYQKLKNIPPASSPKNTVISSAELKTKDGKQVYTFVQSPPVFPGGDKALQAYLIRNLAYLRQNRGELVVLHLVINEKGETEDIKVEKPQDVTLNPAEVEAVIQKMPVWSPGKQNNRPIPVSYTIPIR